MPGGPDDLYDVASALVRFRHRLVDRGDLVLAPDQRQVVLVRTHLDVGDRADEVRGHGLRLALDHEGLERLCLEADARTRRGSSPSPSAGRDEPWPSRAPRGSPHRPSPCTCAGTEARCRPRTRSLVHADPDGHRWARVDDPTKGEQHPLLVVEDRSGAPAVRISLPPSSSTSEPRKQMPYSSTAA